MLGETVVVATDGSAKFSLAAASVVLHEGEAFAIGLEGEDQSSYCAELHALYLLPRAVDRAAAAGAGWFLASAYGLCFGHAVGRGWMELFASPEVSGHLASTSQRCLCWPERRTFPGFPSHSKVTPRWMPHPLVDPAVQRLLNGRADDTARRCMEARLGSLRGRHAMASANDDAWEEATVRASAAAAILYSKHVDS